MNIITRSQRRISFRIFRKAADRVTARSNLNKWYYIAFVQSKRLRYPTDISYFVVVELALIDLKYILLESRSNGKEKKY